MTLPASLLAAARSTPSKAFAEVWDESGGVVKTVRAVPHTDVIATLWAELCVLFGLQATYADLVASMLGAAAFLSDACGVVAGSRVALLAQNSMAYLAVSLGAMCAGGVSLNLNWRQPAATTLQLLEGIRPRALCTSAQHEAESQSHASRLPGLMVVSIDNQCPFESLPLTHPASARFIARAESPDGATAIAAIFFTGGTTGVPKAVPHTHASLLWLSEALLRFYPEPFEVPNAATLCFTPYFHVMGFVANLVFNLHARCRTLLLASPTATLSPLLILRATADLRPNVINTVPFIVEGLVALIEEGASIRGESAQTILSRLDLLTYGGGPLPPHCPPVLAAAGVLLCCTYGQTELAGPVLFGRPGGDADLLRPFKGVGYTLERNEEVDGDDEGELILHGNLSATRDYIRYAGTPEYRSLSSGSNEGDCGSTHTLYRTGDRFRREARADGEWLRYLCRTDDMLVHTSGEMSNPIPIEQGVLAACAPILTEGGCVLCGNAMPRPVLVLELSEAATVSAEGRTRSIYAAIEMANARQPSYSAVLPHHVWLVPKASLPRTVKGGVQRQRVEAMLRSNKLPLQAMRLEEPAEGGEDGGDVFDSMAMATGRYASGSQLITLNIYGTATALVVYSHFFLPLACHVIGPQSDARQAALLASLHALSLDKLNLFIAFCVLAGVDDKRHGWAWPRLARGLIINLLVLYTLLYSTLPAQAERLHAHLATLHPALRCDCGTAGLSATEICPEIAWWPFAINTWRAIGHVTHLHLRLPPWVVPAVSVAVHLLSGASMLPCPLVRLGGCGVGGSKITWLPPLKSPAGLADFWVYYAAAPLLLPRRFPLDLPLTASIERLARRCRCCCCNGQGGVRVVWALTAVALYGLGVLARMTREWRLELANVYAEGRNEASSPIVLLTTKPWSWFPSGEAPRYPNPSPPPTWITHLCALNVLGIGYGLVLVVALAAIVPRLAIPGVTSTGAGALAVYCLQGFVVPAIAPLGNVLLRQLMHSPNPDVSHALIAAAILTLSLGYSWACAGCVSRVVHAFKSKSLVWRALAIIAFAIVDISGHGNTSIAGDHAKAGHITPPTSQPNLVHIGVATAPGCEQRMTADGALCRDCLREAGGTCVVCAARFNCTCDCVGISERRKPVEIAIVGGAASARTAGTPLSYETMLSRMHYATVSNHAIAGTTTAWSSLCLNMLLPGSVDDSVVIIEHAPDDSIHAPSDDALAPLASMERLLRVLKRLRPRARPLIIYVCGPGGRYTNRLITPKCEGLYSPVARHYGVAEISLRTTAFFDSGRTSGGAARFNAYFAGSASGLQPDASGHVAIASLVSEAIEQGVPSLLPTPLPPRLLNLPDLDDAKRCRACGHQSCTPWLRPLYKRGFEPMTVPHGLGGARAWVADGPGHEIRFTANGHVTLATMCMPAAAAGMIQVSLTDRCAANASARTRMYDLRWRQPVRAQCLLQLGVVYGEVAIRTLARPTLRPGMRSAVRLLGVIDGPEERGPLCNARAVG